MTDPTQPLKATIDVESMPPVEGGLIHLTSIDFGPCTWVAVDPDGVPDHQAAYPGWAIMHLVTLERGDSAAATLALDATRSRLVSVVPLVPGELHVALNLDIARAMLESLRCVIDLLEHPEP